MEESSQFLFRPVGMYVGHLHSVYVTALGCTLNKEIIGRE